MSIGFSFKTCPETFSSRFPHRFELMVYPRRPTRLNASSIPATNSTLSSEMRHALLLQGLSMLFQAPAHRLLRDDLYIAQFLSPVLKQLQRPVGITLGKVAPLYGYKVRFGYSVVNPGLRRP